MSRPAPERPGDELPTPDDFAGWPPLGALETRARHGHVPMLLQRLDARAAEAVAGLRTPAAGTEHALRLEFTRASRGPWLGLRAGDRARTAAWEERGGLVWVTHHAALLMDSTARRGIVVLTDQGADDTVLSVQNVLRVASAWNALREESGMLLHAAAVGLEGGAAGPERCVLLLGESGAGKSTAARLSAPRPVLADDTCLVTLGPGGGPAIVGWAQSFAAEDFPGRADAAPRGGDGTIAGIFRLRQAPRHEVVPLRGASAAASIAAHAPFVLDSMRPAALRLAERVAGGAPAAELRFAKDAGFWAGIDHFLEGAARPGDTR